MSPRALVRSMAALSDPLEALGQVVDRTLAVVPHAESVLATLSPARQETMVVGSDEVATGMYAAQGDAAQGPTLDAMTELVIISGHDLATDPRWPTLAPRTVDLGVAAAVALPIIVDDNSVGTLTILGRTPCSLSESTLHTAAPIAAIAGLVLARIDIAGSFAEAMSSRDVIGQAKGILMERHRIDAAAAFERLKEASQRSNRRLRDVADHLAATGEEPVLD